MIMKKVALCLPVFNEGKRVEQTINILINFLKNNITFANWVIILVDDGSSDESPYFLSKISNEFPSIVNTITHSSNLGYGAANYSAVTWCLNNSIEYCVYMDADQTQDPIFLLKVSDLIDKGYDVIKASRYIDGARVEGVPFFRCLVSKVGNLIAKAFLDPPLTDFTNGFRAIKVNNMSSFKPKDKGFSYILEEVAFLSSNQFLRWAEFPYVLTNRPSKGKQSAFDYRIQTYFNYLKHLG
jgi:dolichol-phosphate mannosyltransferase